MIQLILTTIVTLFVLGVLRFVFGFKRDKAGNPRVAGVIVPEWVMYLGYFAIATITLEISWYLLEDLSLYYAYELKNYLETRIPEKNDKERQNIYNQIAHNQDIEGIIKTQNV